MTLPYPVLLIVILSSAASKNFDEWEWLLTSPQTHSTTSTSTTPTLIPVTIPLDTNTPSPDPTTTPITSTIPKTSATTPTSSTWTATPFISVLTITGQVKTSTVTPTAPPASATTVVAAKDNSGGGFFSDSDKVAGTFVTLALVICALAGAAIWFFFFRRKRQPPDVQTLASTAGGNTPLRGGNTPQRRPSRLSQMGLLGGAAEGEKIVPTLQTSGWGPGNSNEKSPADTLSADRRSSFPRVVDQRLEPTALWNPLHDNGSHVSVRSFRDDQDYSRRMLRVSPFPPAKFPCYNY